MTRPARRWREEPEPRRPSPAEQLAGLGLFAPADARAETLAEHEAEHSRHRAMLLSAFQQHGAMTADTAGEKVGLSPFQSRPRCCQLQQQKYGAKLRPSGRRGVSALGNPAAILELTPEGAHG